MADARIKAVVFDETAHRYTYGGRELFGVTGTIGSLLGKKFPDTLVVQAGTVYGHDVHKECELWIKEGRKPSTMAGEWLVGTLEEFRSAHGVDRYEAELIVSDFEGTASCIDIVARHKDGSVTLFDIKTTSRFDRPYCSLQLSVYKRLFEACYGCPVAGMFVLATKSERTFRILAQPEQTVSNILDINRRKAGWK
jgi:hypothetical protein